MQLKHKHRFFVMDIYNKEATQPMLDTLIELLDDGDEIILEHTTGKYLILCIKSPYVEETKM